MSDFVGQFFMGAKLFIGTPWMRNEGVLKKFGLGYVKLHGSFETVSRGYILVSFNRHCCTMNLVKEKQGGLVPPGLKRCPFKLINHFADIFRVSQSPAGPAGCCSLNFLNLINLKFRVRALYGCCIL